jgi:cold shock protein
MEGTVKFFNRRKGFGFVSGEDGKDYFVHFTALKQGTFLRDNDKVSFDAEEGDKGPKAVNVTLLEKASDRSDLPAEEGDTPAAEEPAQEEAPAEEETPVEEASEEPAQEETPAEEPAQEEAKPEEETPAEEPAQEEAPAEEPKTE